MPGALATAGLVALVAGSMIVPAAGALVQEAAKPGAPGAPSASIAWTPDRSLNWSHYRASPAPGSDASAMTVHRIAYEEGCDEAAFFFKVVSYFEPDRSWVKSAAVVNLTMSQRLLIHEQGHFDLSEVQARKLRQMLAAMRDPCAKTVKERQDLVLRELRKDRDVQARYDAETNYGRNSSQQTRWLGEVDRQLKALEAYVDRRP